MTDLNPTQRVRAFYRQYAPRYDQQAAWYDRVMLGDGRAGRAPKAGVRCSR